MQLEGSLAQFPLAELISLSVSTSVTGVLEIGRGNSVGRIFCRDGHIYHATDQNLTGFEALCSMFEDPTATFCFTAGVLSKSETLWQDVDELIERAQQQAILWAQVRKDIRDLQVIPVLCNSGHKAAVQISEATWPVLAAIDGQRSIVAIAEALGQVPIEVALGLQELLQQGVIRLDPPLPPVRKPPPSATLRQSSKNSFFKRLMASSTAKEVQVQSAAAEAAATLAKR